jgi:hypothetical protein
MAATKTVKLADGKYEFDIQDGQMTQARRNGVFWPAGHEERFNHSFVAALNRILELEASRARLRDGMQQMGYDPDEWDKPSE